ALRLISCGQTGSKEKQKEAKKSDTVENKNAVDSNNNKFPENTSLTTIDTAGTSNVAQMVSGIRHEVERINALRLYRKEVRFVCDAENTITYYTHNSRVVKIIIEWGFVGDGSSKYEYYYKKGKLIFTFKVHVGGPAGLPQTKIEERTYVDNDKTIKYMKNQKVTACSVCQFTESSKEYKALNAYAKNNVKALLCN
ncbi:MAG: hypothetical protein V4676_04795, partial [Bacteroidota bacterium]